MLTFLFVFVDFIFMTNAAFFLCASGHQGFNKYLSGKTTYFNSFESNEEIYISNGNPPEIDGTMYLWHDTSSNFCYKFLALKSKHFVATTNMSVEAVCNDCSSNVTSPSQCPLWNINGYGLDSKFSVVANEVCSADNWREIDIDSKQKQPHNICTWNMSLTDDIVYGMNNQHWELWSNDMNGNPYYYNKNNLLYIYQMHYQYASANMSWYWVINNIIGLPHYNGLAYCEMNENGYAAVDKCKKWYFLNANSDVSEYILLDVNIRNDSCDFVSSNICIYAASIVDLNGDYKLLLDSMAYNGYHKDSKYYVRFIDNKWKIGYPNDLSAQTYAICEVDGADPFDISECNGYWRSMVNTNVFDAMQIYYGLCSDITMKPTSIPTLFPTKIPSISPTIIYNNMQFNCYYNDNNTNYYAIQMSLQQYAQIMQKIIKKTFNEVNILNVYDNIFDVQICSVFDGIPIHNFCPNNGNTHGISSKYKAVGTFSISTNNLNEYKKHIEDVMESQQFIINFENNMNVELNNIHFQVIEIEIVDLLTYDYNDTQNIYESTIMVYNLNQNITNLSMHSEYLLLIAIFTAALVVVAIFVFVFTKSFFNENKIEFMEIERQNNIDIDIENSNSNKESITLVADVENEGMIGPYTGE